MRQYLLGCDACGFFLVCMSVPCGACQLFASEEDTKHIHHKHKTAKAKRHVFAYAQSKPNTHTTSRSHQLPSSNSSVAHIAFI